MKETKLSSNMRIRIVKIKDNCYQLQTRSNVFRSWRTEALYPTMIAASQAFGEKVKELEKQNNAPTKISVKRRKLKLREANYG
jgi:hypothetical protein